MGDMPIKRVDESWKNEVDKERKSLREAWGEPRRTSDSKSSDRTSPRAAADAGTGAVDARASRDTSTEEVREEASPFVQFLLGMRMQALLALGEIPHPVTQQPEVQPDQAQYIIETLAMLQEKTAGNLSRYEAEVFEQLMYELRVRYVQLMQPPPHPDQAP